MSSPIREWALANGHDIGTRGRIPDSIVLAYQDAHDGHIAPGEWSITVDLPGVSPEAEARLCELIFDLVTEAYRAGLEAAP